MALRKLRRKLRIVVDGNGKYKVQCSYFGFFWSDFGSRRNAYAESWRPDLYDNLKEAQQRLVKMYALQLGEVRARDLTEVERVSS